MSKLITSQPRKSTLRRRLNHRSVNRLTVVILICSICSLCVPTPIQATVLRVTGEKLSNVGFEVRGSFGYLLSALILSVRQEERARSGLRPGPAPTKAERYAAVERVEMNPGGEVLLQSQQPLLLSAIPLDQRGQPVHGLRAIWESSDKQIVFVRANGNALAGKPGVAIVTARIGSKWSSVRVTVVEGTKDRFGGKKKIGSSRGPSATLSTRNELVARKSNRKEKRAHVFRPVKSLSGVMPFIRDPNVDPLPDNETNSLYQNNNLVGSPQGKTNPGALTAASAIPLSEGSNKNFSFGLPAVAIPGRGIDASLSLIYNSLLWNKSISPSDSSTWMTYDVDSGYPAPGFRIGFGQIEDQGSAGFTLTDSNGTRHALVFSSPNNYVTDDGTFIHFTGGSGWGTAFYPDGTQVTYGAAGGGYRSFPTSITDRNGNYITISYVNNVGPRIYIIQDTIGRYVRFYYDSNNDLITITKPGLTGQSDLQVMRFYYENLTLPSGLFGAGVNVDEPATARVLKHLYLPTSAEGSSGNSGDIGYRFDYSQYGMIYRVTRFHGMTASTTSTSSMGTVTEGSNTQAAITTYDYPLNASGLSDVPTYVHRTDDWAGRTGGGSAPQHTFSVSESSTESTSTVIAPDGTNSVTISIKNIGVWNDGLVKETRVQNPSSVVFAKTVLSWEQNTSNGTPRIASIRQTNEAGKTVATVLSYDPSTPYNNVSVVSERGFTTDGSVSPTELRRTEATYISSSNYLNRRLFRLPSMIKVFPGESSTPASRVDFGYDNYGSGHANLTALMTS